MQAGGLPWMRESGFMNDDRSTVYSGNVVGSAANSRAFAATIVWRIRMGEDVKYICFLIERLRNCGISHRHNGIRLVLIEKVAGSPCSDCKEMWSRLVLCGRMDIIDVVRCDGRVATFIVPHIYYASGCSGIRRHCGLQSNRERVVLSCSSIWPFGYLDCFIHLDVLD